MKYRLLAFSLILAGLFSTSCLQEDYSDCFRRYKLILSYLGDGETEIFPEKIDKVEMYVFDQDNNCVSAYTLPEADVESRMTDLPALKPGNYRIICVGNAYETGVENLASRDYREILFAADDFLKGNVVSGNDSLYYASKDLTVIGFDPKNAHEDVVVPFASSHYDVLVEIINAPDWVGRHPKVELIGVSPYTDFENDATGSPTDYVMDTEHNGINTTIAEANIMRHDNHEEVYLKVTGEDGNIVAMINFAEHIEKHKDHIDPTKHECLIPFRLEWDPTICADVIIDLPKWIDVEVTPGFTKK